MEYDFKNGYFSHREVFGILKNTECQDLLVNHKWRNNLYLLLNILDEIRGEIGVPMILTSTFRDINHNLAVGGVSTSQHLTGEAIDFAFNQARRDEGVTRFIELVTRAYKDQIGQVIIHDTFIHVALPNVKHPKLEIHDQRANQRHT